MNVQLQAASANGCIFVYPRTKLTFDALSRVQPSAILMGLVWVIFIDWVLASWYFKPAWVISYLHSPEYFYLWNVLPGTVFRLPYKPANWESIFLDSGVIRASFSSIKKIPTVPHIIWVDLSNVVWRLIWPEIQSLRHRQQKIDRYRFFESTKQLFISFIPNCRIFLLRKGDAKPNNWAWHQFLKNGAQNGA